MCIYVIKFFTRKIRTLYYRVLVHPDLTEGIPVSKNIKLIAVTQPSPDTLKNIDAIIVSKEINYKDEWKSLILHAANFDTPIIDSANYDELVEGRLSLDQLNENWMSSMFSISIGYMYIKNICEFCLTIVFLPLLLVIFAIVSAIILVTMGGPVFYTQQRVGKKAVYLRFINLDLW